jgi:hypothetical protein
MSSTETSVSIQRLAVAAEKISVDRQSNQIKWLDTKALPYVDKQISAISGENKTAAKRFLDTVRNLVVSYKEGMETGDTAKSPLKSLSKDLEKEVAAYSPSTKAKSKETSAETFDVHAYDAATVKALNNYAKYLKVLPATITKKFVSLRMPVLAVTKGGMHLDKLKDRGFSKDNIFGYPVLLNQLVVGFEYTNFQTTYKGNWAEATEDIIENIHEKTKRRFVALGKPIKFKSVFYVWLVEEKDLNAFNQMSFGGHLLVKQWAFPFASSLPK